MLSVAVYFSFYVLLLINILHLFRKIPNCIKELLRRTLTYMHQCITASIKFDLKKTLFEAFSIMTLHIKGLFLWHSAYTALWINDTLDNYAVFLWSVIMLSVAVYFSFFCFTFNQYSASFQKNTQLHQSATKMSLNLIASMHYTNGSIL